MIKMEIDFHVKTITIIIMMTMGTIIITIVAFEVKLTRDYQSQMVQFNLYHMVQYDNYVDRYDYEYGHGTHDAWSIAGCKSDGGGIAKAIAYDEYNAVKVHAYIITLMML